MNMLQLSIASLRFRALGNGFNALVLALGVALIIMLLQVSSQLEKRFDKDLQGIDLVVGAKGSPVQLILSSVFHLDSPTGNISIKEADKLRKHPMIQSAIPLALGDSYKGFRIVGTEYAYYEQYNAKLAQGKWEDAPMDAVLGSEVAQASRLKIGDSFSGAHGLEEGGEEHATTPYKVTGILAATGTVIDRLVVTDIESVWNVHHHDEDTPKKGKNEPEEITSLLIRYKTPLATATLPRLVNATTSMQAASPAMEMARLSSLLGIGSEVAGMFAYALMAIAAVGAFVSLLAAVNERQYDMALLRTLGMTRIRLSAFVLMQGSLIGVVGAVLGLILGHIFTATALHWIATTRHMTLSSGGFESYELGIALAAIALSASAALIPALMAYRMNVVTVLSRRS